MKKILSLIVVAFMLLACNFNPSFTYQETFSSQEEVLKWVAENITYSDIDAENWQTPEETYNLRTGDCEDFVILAMYFLHEIGIDSELVVIRGVNNLASRHAVILVNNVYYEAQTGTTVWYPMYVLITYSYDFVMDYSFIRELQ